MNKALPAKIADFVDAPAYEQAVSDMLAMAKQLGADQAEVGMNASIGLNVTVRKLDVETIEFNRDKSVGITVYMNQRKGSASTTDVSPASLKSAVEAAVNLAKLTEPDSFAGLANAQEMAKTTPNLDLYHPWDITMEQAIQLAKTCEESGLSINKKITNSDGASFHSGQGFHVYGNSHGFRGSYPSSRHSLSCVLIAQDAKGMERDYQYTVARNHTNMVKAAQIGQEAAERTLARLNARKIPTQKAPILIHSSVAAGFLSNFIGAISGGRLFRKSSFLADSLDKQIFPAFVNIYERPHLLGAMGSAPFDSDGVATSDKDFVKAGIVTNYVLSAYSARKLQMQNTGNAGGVHNLFIEPGADDYEGMLKKLGTGLLVTELMGPGINLVTGDYSRGASGFWVENGQIQYPVAEITVAGNLKDMFKGLVAVGNDVDRRSSIQSGSLLIEEMMISGE